MPTTVPDVSFVRAITQGIFLIQSVGLTLVIMVGTVVGAYIMKFVLERISDIDLF